MTVRKQLAHEDAAEGCVLLAPKPKREWRCDRCSTKMKRNDLNCSYCGDAREDE